MDTLKTRRQFETPQVVTEVIHQHIDTESGDAHCKSSQTESVLPEPVFIRPKRTIWKPVSAVHSGKSYMCIW
jgi:hypothetical protein